MHLRRALFITAIIGAILYQSETLNATPHFDLPPGAAYGIDTIAEDTLFFKSNDNSPPPRPLKTHLFDLVYLGYLGSPGGGSPYFLLSGRSCQNCLEDKVIYLIRSEGGKPEGFVYPGKIIDPKNHSVLLESRAFFGKCLPNHGSVYVVFQKEKMDRKRFLQPSVFIAEPMNKNLQEVLLERHLPHIQTAIQFVKRKLCWEVDGRNRIMISKPLGLTPQRLSEESEADDRNEEPEGSERPEGALDK